MAKQTIEIDVPDGMEVSDCYQFGSGGFQAIGDTIAASEYRRQTFIVIIKPAWQWPSWLKAGWIAMDNGGIWFAFDKEPSMSSQCWNGYSIALNDGRLFNFTPPPCDDWTKSLRRNPNK